MSWRHLSMNSRLNLPANVFSFRYVIKGPLKSPLNSYFSFCARDFRGDQMRSKKNLYECSSRLRRVSGKCWELRFFFFGVDAVLRQASLIVPNHATKVKLKIRSKANCCFPSKDKCSNNSNLVPCPQRILRIPMALNELKITEQVKR